MADLTRRSAPGTRGSGVAFAQVREDPSVELAALAPPGAHLVGITSGGDTALGLLAAGAARVTAIDVNPDQNHHVELLHAALTRLPREEALALIGAHPVADLARADHYRADLYRAVAPGLGEAARAWWDAHPRALHRGPLHAGRAERRIAAVAAAQPLVAPRRAWRDLLACTDSATQRSVFEHSIDTRRWRAAVALVFNPTTCRPLYRQFFRHIDASRFTTTMREGIVSFVRDTPAWRNWYLHDIVEGHYRPDCLPPHLDGDRSAWGHLHLIDGDISAVLADVPAHSVDGVWLSNVGEWLPAPAFESLLRTAARAVRPGGRLAWSYFVPRPEPLPAALRDRLAPLAVPDVLDRSLIRFQRVLAEVR